MSQALDDHVRAQRDAMAKLREDYQFVYEVISFRASLLAISNNNNNNSVNLMMSVNAASSSSSSISVSQQPSTAGGGDAATASGSEDSGLAASVGPKPETGGVLSSQRGIHANMTASSTGADGLAPAGEVGIGFDSDGEVVALLKQLEGRRKAQETEVLAQMTSRSATMMELKDDIAARKASLMTTSAAIMRSVATVQTDIQFKLKKGMEVMKKWQQGHNRSVCLSNLAVGMPTHNNLTNLIPDLFLILSY